MKNPRYTSQSGMITVDFLFAFVLVMGFAAILFSLSMTLTVAEVTQYATYTAARAYTAGHLSIDDQTAQANRKYLSFLGGNAVKRLYTNGWFEVMQEPDVGDISQLMPGYQQEPSAPNAFVGVGTSFTARMLDFKIPFYGSTSPDEDSQGSGFSTYLASYLGREVSARECYGFVQQRWQAIRQLPAAAGTTSYSNHTSEKGYFVYDDNGC